MYNNNHFKIYLNTFFSFHVTYSKQTSQCTCITLYFLFLPLIFQKMSQAHIYTLTPPVKFGKNATGSCYCFLKSMITTKIINLTDKQMQNIKSEKFLLVSKYDTFQDKDISLMYIKMNENSKVRKLAKHYTALRLKSFQEQRK